MRSLIGSKAYRGSFLIAALIGILPRVWLWFSYPFAQGNDTPTYIHLANNLRNNLGFAKYNGTRVPGYPFFILISGDPRNLFLLQLIFGLLTSLILFALFSKLIHNPLLGLLVSASHSLNLGQLFYEASMLTEALSAFFFLLSVTLVYLAILREKRESGLYPIMLLLGSGVSAVILASIRPLFLPFPFIAALFLLRFKNKNALIRSFGSAVLLALPTFVALLVWVGFIYFRFNVIGLDAIGGYHLVNHTSSFFELASDEHAVVRDIFTRYRDARIAETGSAVNTIWDAIPELMETTKLNYYALGKQMGEISRELIRQNPILYIVNVVKGWFWFWKVGVFWNPNDISNPILRLALESLMFIQRLLLIASNGVFLLVSTLHIGPKVRQILHPSRFTYLLITFIWVISILQSFAEHGDNPRFLAPAQSLIVGLIVLWVAKAWQWRQHARP